MLKQIMSDVLFLGKKKKVSPCVDFKEINTFNQIQNKSGFRRGKNKGVGSTEYFKKKVSNKQIGGFRRLTPQYALENNILIKEKYQKKYWYLKYSKEELDKYNKVV